ncbi:coiled-coil domain-containing protein 7-like isoform X1 [Apodemus sylvaticus]|uniref:coiled-coil domain-containing protein 7-like isoform X1 n=1 Tax=Apodemus sylvaticus TaxID=10129 RepID=UPI00224430D3|nr:coiled-coil domain-containing protein 7-like isoform X1 [Apodemus sylvaticus]
MKRAKHPATVSMKLTSVPELPYKKGPLNSSPKPKEKRNAKSTQDKIEPMVIRSPPTGESIVRYALPIPSTMMKDLVSDAEMVRMIAKNLKTVVSTLEETYGAFTDDGEKATEKSEAEGLSVGDDMNSFLLCCSQFATQLEEAVKEERGILESLFKWFQQQVNQMEEISKDQSNLQADLPSDDKFVNKGITQIAKLIRKFEDIKGRLKERRVSLQSKQTDKDLLSESLKHYALIEQQIEEFIKSHSALGSQYVFETESGTPSSMTNRMAMMMKIFENQAAMLEKALNDQRIIESKYQQIETDYQNLLSEKNLLEGEIQRLRDTERPKSASKEERTKKSGKSEKKKDKDSERKLSPSREEELQIQEAERNKTQVDSVLHQKTEMFKEEKNKTKLDRGHSKSKVKGEDTKDSLPKKSDIQSSEQRKDQISSDQSKRSVGER